MIERGGKGFVGHWNKECQGGDWVWFCGMKIVGRFASFFWDYIGLTEVAVRGVKLLRSFASFSGNDIGLQGSGTSTVCV